MILNCTYNDYIILLFEFIINNNIIILSTPILGILPIIFVSGAAKEAAKKIGKIVLGGAATAGSIYTGGKEIIKDIKNATGNSGSENSGTGDQSGSVNSGSSSTNENKS
jgi:hypothetical protein